ncbi:MAG TPA: hypothetical protein VGE41_11395, partial [Verrucomicrobiae bacterium]
VPTLAFKELELTSIPSGERTKVFFSSGTSLAKTSRHFHFSASMQIYEESLWLWFERCFLANKRAGMAFLYLTPPAGQAPHSSLVHMFATIARRAGTAESHFGAEAQPDGSWSVNEHACLDFLERAIDENQPIEVLGTAFTFVHLLDALSSRKLALRLPAGSRVLETGGYKGRSRVLTKPELHKLISQVLGVLPTHIVSEYGMSELSSQAYDEMLGDVSTEPHGSNSDAVAARRVFQFPSWARAQIISPETGLEVQDGQTGLIRIYDLANVYSVAAIQTEDLGVRRGSRFELLGRASEAEPRGCSLMSIDLQASAALLDNRPPIAR